jgi:hypothetical protein
MPMLTIKEAADELVVSRRWLEYWLADHPVDAAGFPFYVQTGRSKKFALTDIERMLAHMRDLERARLGPLATAATGNSRLVARLAQLGGYDELVKLREKERQKNEAGKATLHGRLGPEASELKRARYGYKDKNGNFRRIVAGLRAGQVRVVAPDGRKWVEDVNPTDPASWQQRRKLKPRTPTSE